MPGASTSRLAFAVQSGSGAPITVRSLGASDLSAVIGFVLSLDCRRRRPLFPAGTPAAAIRAHYDLIDWSITALFGWFEAGALRGVAEASLAWDGDLAILLHPCLRGDPGLDLLGLCAGPRRKRQLGQPSVLYAVHGRAGRAEALRPTLLPPTLLH